MAHKQLLLSTGVVFVLFGFLLAMVGVGYLTAPCGCPAATSSASPCQCISRVTGYALTYIGLFLTAFGTIALAMLKFHKVKIPAVNREMNDVTLE